MVMQCLLHQICFTARLEIKKSLNLLFRQELPAKDQFCLMQASNNYQVAVTPQIAAKVMRDIDRRLRDFDKTLSHFGLTAPPQEEPDVPAVTAEVHRFDQEQLQQNLQGVPGLNADQRAVFDSVPQAAADRRENVSHLVLQA